MIKIDIFKLTTHCDFRESSSNWNVIGIQIMSKVTWIY